MASYTCELWGALRKACILLVVQILSTMDLWVKVEGVISSLVHSFPEEEDGAGHGAQHRAGDELSVNQSPGQHGQSRHTGKDPCGEPLPISLGTRPPQSGSGVHMFAANLDCGVRDLWVMLCSMCRPAQRQQRADSVLCHQLLLCSGASQPHLAPGSSGTPQLGSNLELPCLHTAQHPQKHPQRGQHSARTPGSWAKLLITNTITTTQTNSTIWLHRGVHLTRIIWSYICVQAFHYSHAQGCFTFIFMLFCLVMLYLSLPSATSAGVAAVKW